MNGNDIDPEGRSNINVLDPPGQRTIVTPDSQVARVSSQPPMERFSYPSSPPVPVSNPEYTSEPLPHQHVVVSQGANPVLVAALIAIGAVIILGLILLIAGLIFFSNLAKQITSPAVGDLTTETQSVALGAASSAVIDLNMGVGNLTLSGGATDLMDANFTYNVDTWKPLVSYNVVGTGGTLIVEQPNSNNISTPPGTRYDWELRFKNDVPMTMKVDVGVGQGNLKMSGLNLSRLEVNNGVGNSTIDLSGNWNQDVDVLVNGGVGQVTVILPADTGVRITTEGGLGHVNANGLTANGSTYTNSSYGKTTHTINIDIKSGLGDIQLVGGR